MRRKHSVLSLAQHGKSFLCSFLKIGLHHVDFSLKLFYPQGIGNLEAKSKYEKWPYTDKNPKVYGKVK